MIKTFVNVRVEMTCDACGASNEQAAGTHESQVPALTGELQRTKGWRQLSGKDVCPGCAARVLKIFPEAK